MSSKTPFGYLLLSGVFLFFDRFFKWQAQHDWSGPVSINRFLGWEPFMNKGIAFGINLPLYATLILSLIIMTVVGYLFYLNFRLKNGGMRSVQGAGLVLILTGSVSNLADRLLYGNTIDYVRIFTGIINIADCLIVAGFVLYFWTLKQLQKNVN